MSFSYILKEYIMVNTRGFNLEREAPDFLERERRLWLFVVGEGGFTPPSSFGF
jgi:hypothetical protein